MNTLVTRLAALADVATLHELELQSFEQDRLSRRSFRRFIKTGHHVFLVVEQRGAIIAYGLALLHPGTRLARLYSLAVAPAARGKGVSRVLMHELEERCAERGRLFMRLEVSAENNAAVRLYEALGYVAFGTYSDYYEDHGDALRMQKRIRYRPQNMVGRWVPWYGQTTEFTCGPAAIMMAMASLDERFGLDQKTELDIWREATTIFMTSGHGGCHPLGLALAAVCRGFECEAYINQRGPLFIESVRQAHKKAVMRVVNEQFEERARQSGIAIHYRAATQSCIARHLTEGDAIVTLISTHRLNGKRAPHWVTLSGVDALCFYLHDPDVSSEEQTATDCRDVPVARDDFDKMTAFGRERLRTCVVLRRRTDQSREHESLRRAAFAKYYGNN